MAVPTTRSPTDGCSARWVERGAWAATTEFKLNLLAPAREGTLDAEARIVSLTRRTAVVQVEVANEGRLACLAQGTVPVAAPRG